MYPSMYEYRVSRGKETVGGDGDGSSLDVASIQIQHTTTTFGPGTCPGRRRRRSRPIWSGQTPANVASHPCLRVASRIMRNVLLVNLGG